MPSVSHDPSTVPASVGGYAQAVELSAPQRLLLVSGQIPEDREGGVPEGCEAQCRQAWRNLFGVLESAGMGAGDLVKVTTYLTDPAQAEAKRPRSARVPLGARAAGFDGGRGRDARVELAAGDRGDRGALIVEALARERFGLDGRATPLPGEMDHNFALDGHGLKRHAPGTDTRVPTSSQRQLRKRSGWRAGGPLSPLTHIRPA